LIGVSPPDPVPASEPVLVFASVSKSYGGTPALHDVTLDVAPGEVLALLGANGAGKTTLLSIASGLRAPDSGTVAVFGQDPRRGPDGPRSLVGFAPQELAVYPPLSARENLILFAELAGLRGADRNRRIAETADALGLRGLLDRRVGALSGGMQRRLHVAIAFLHRPPLVLLDEPSAGFDVDGRSGLLHAVVDAAAAGAAVLYSTNRLDEAEELNRCVAILDRGKVVARGRVSELIGAHAGAPDPTPTGGLHAVFAALTGRRYEPALTTATGSGDVPAT
jgi:ABC-2 type transport system ATP-binding protein